VPTAENIPLMPFHIPLKKPVTADQTLLIPFHAVVKMSLKNFPTAANADFIPFHMPLKKAGAAFQTYLMPFQAIENDSRQLLITAIIAIIAASNVISSISQNHSSIGFSTPSISSDIRLITSTSGGRIILISSINGSNIIKIRFIIGLSKSSIGCNNSSTGCKIEIKIGRICDTICTIGGKSILIKFVSGGKII